MVRPQERDLDVREIYTTRPPDMISGQVYFDAFAKLHDINGHKIMCIFTKANNRSLTLTLDGGDSPGVTASSSVLVIDSREVSGMRIHESLRVDGQIFTITRISQPIANVTRLELSGYSG